MDSGLLAALGPGMAGKPSARERHFLIWTADAVVVG
jgi:hypothetical protein